MLEYMSLVSTTMVIVNTAIFAYVYLKVVKNHDFYLDLMDDILDYAAKDEESLKKVWTIGSVLGNGLKTGLGVDKIVQKNGKFKMDDIIGLGIQYFMGKIMPQTDNSLNNSTEQPNPLQKIVQPM